MPLILRTHLQKPFGHLWNYSPSKILQLFPSSHRWLTPGQGWWNPFGAPANLPVRARSGHPWTSLDYIYIYSLGGCRSVPSVAPTRDRLVRAKSGTATRVHARACRATRFQPLRNKSSEENLPEGINVGVGSPRVFCPPSRIPRGEG